MCREVWSQDSERLTLELCEEAGEEEEDSPVQAQCCACEEAKYEVEFQGLWSKAADSNKKNKIKNSRHFSVESAPIISDLDVAC